MTIVKYAVLAVVLVLTIDARSQVKRYDNYPEYESEHFEDRPEGLWRSLAVEKGLKSVTVERFDSAKGDTQRVYGFNTIGKRLREEFVRYGSKYLRDSVISEFDSLGHIVRRENHDYLQSSIALYQYANGNLAKKYTYRPEHNELRFTSYYLGPNGHFRRIVDHDDNAKGFAFITRRYDHSNLINEREWMAASDYEKTHRYKYDSLGRMTEMTIEQNPVDSNRQYSLSSFNKRLVFRDSGRVEYKVEYSYNTATSQWNLHPSFLTVTDSLHNATIRFSLDSNGKAVGIDSTFMDFRKHPIKSVQWTYYDNKINCIITRWEYGDHGEIISEKKEYGAGKTSLTLYHYHWK